MHRNQVSNHFTFQKVLEAHRVGPGVDRKLQNRRIN